jgi:hypothetical protein
MSGSGGIEILRQNKVRRGFPFWKTGAEGLLFDYGVPPKLSICSGFAARSGFIPVTTLIVTFGQEPWTRLPLVLSPVL